MKRRTKLLYLLLPALIFLFVGFYISKNIFENLKRFDINTPRLSEKMTRENTIEKREARNLKVNVWVAGWDGEAALNSLKKSEGILTNASPVFYSINKKGEKIAVDFKMKDEILSEIYRQNLSITPLLFNEFDPERVSTILNSGNQSELIDKLISVSQKNGYSGWDINWEQIDNKDQRLFVRFLKEAKSRFADSGIKLIATIPAKTGESSDWSGATGYDWREISTYSDEVRIMAYDYHNQSTPPGAVTPFDWYSKVVQHALDNIPLEKITISLPLYGYKWDRNGKFVASTNYKDLEGGNFVQVDNSLKVVLQDGSTVWTEDSETIFRKIQFAYDNGISSFSFWRSGAEADDFWGLLDQKIAEQNRFDLKN